MTGCSHKFVDSKHCLLCGWMPPPRAGKAPEDRVMIVGGPRCGKSWFARELRGKGYPTFCGDPIDKVKDVEPGVTYLDAGMGMESASSRYIVDNWLPMPGPWVLEGHIMARVLRKWLDGDQGIVDPQMIEARGWPCDRIVVFEQQRAELDLLPGQRALHKGTMKVWREISDYFEGMYETRRWSDD